MLLKILLIQVAIRLAATKHDIDRVLDGRGDANIGVPQIGPGLTLSGTISGPFAITKVGAGNLYLNGSNTFTGGVARVKVLPPSGTLRR